MPIIRRATFTRRANRPFGRSSRQPGQAGAVSFVSERPTQAGPTSQLTSSERRRLERTGRSGSRGGGGGSAQQQEQGQKALTPTLTQTESERPAPTPSRGLLQGRAGFRQGQLSQRGRVLSERQIQAERESVSSQSRRLEPQFREEAEEKGFTITEKNGTLQVSASPGKEEEARQFVQDFNRKAGGLRTRQEQLRFDVQRTQRSRSPGLFGTPSAFVSQGQASVPVLTPVPFKPSALDRFAGFEKRTGEKLFTLPFEDTLQGKILKEDEKRNIGRTTLLSPISEKLGFNQEKFGRAMQARARGREEGIFQTVKERPITTFVAIPAITATGGAGLTILGGTGTAGLITAKTAGAVISGVFAGKVASDVIKAPNPLEQGRVVGRVTPFVVTGALGGLAGSQIGKGIVALKPTDVTGSLGRRTVIQRTISTKQLETRDVTGFSKQLTSKVDVQTFKGTIQGRPFKQFSVQTTPRRGFDLVELGKGKSLQRLIVSRTGNVADVKLLSKSGLKLGSFKTTLKPTSIGKSADVTQAPLQKELSTLFDPKSGITKIVGVQARTGMISSSSISKTTRLPFRTTTTKTLEGFTSSTKTTKGIVGELRIGQKTFQITPKGAKPVSFESFVKQPSVKFSAKDLLPPRSTLNIKGTPLGFKVGSSRQPTFKLVDLTKTDVKAQFSLKQTSKLISVGKKGGRATSIFQQPKKTFKVGIGKLASQVPKVNARFSTEVFKPISVGVVAVGISKSISQQERFKFPTVRALQLPKTVLKSVEKTKPITITPPVEVTATKSKGKSGTVTIQDVIGDLTTPPTTIQFPPLIPITPPVPPFRLFGSGLFKRRKGKKRKVKRRTKFTQTLAGLLKGKRKFGPNITFTGLEIFR